jgi:hypothetical protein
MSRRLDGGDQPASTWQSRPESEGAGFAGAEAGARAEVPALPAPEHRRRLDGAGQRAEGPAWPAPEREDAP